MQKSGRPRCGRQNPGRAANFDVPYQLVCPLPSPSHIYLLLHPTTSKACMQDKHEIRTHHIKKHLQMQITNI